MSTYILYLVVLSALVYQGCGAVKTDEGFSPREKKIIFCPFAPGGFYAIITLGESFPHPHSAEFSAFLRFYHMLELLSPAGSMEALRAAVQNGADAVYLGYGSFNARQGAKNFTTDELREAVKYCHIRGVRVHLTLNTLATDRELPRVAELIRTAALCDVDAFIVQDLGVVSLCRQIAPHIPLHASTQMSIHNLEGVRQAAAMGLSRVVLARELDRQQIAYICRNSPIEIEVFVHGALCMCYSGQCYMSAIIGRRSGNRGQCAQPSRLPYGYSHFEAKYPLSLKDNCLLPWLQELEAMGVASIKIEGRMKRPEYVAIATKTYRSVLDSGRVNRRQLSDLRDAFSRQGFTQGYFMGQTGPDMFGTRTDAPPNEALFARARASFERGEAARVPVQFYAVISRQQGSMLAVQDNDGHICKTTGPAPSEAINQPIDEALLSSRLSKTGGTPYHCTGVRSVIEPGLTLPASAVNAMRREVLDHLTALRGRRDAPRLGNFTSIIHYSGAGEPPKLTVSVTRADQLIPALADAAIVYAPLHLICDEPRAFRALPQETELVAVLPRIIHDRETAPLVAKLDAAYERGVRKVLTGNLGQLSIARSRGFSLCGDFGFNAFNSRTMLELRSLGLISATASFEMTIPQIRDLSKAIPTELIIYGRLPLMLTENCVIQNRNGSCACRSGSTKLIDRVGAEFPIIRDGNSCRSVILNGKRLYWLDKQPELQRLGLSYVRIQFTTESSAEVARVMESYRTGAPFDPGACTRGLYARGVE